MPFKLFAPIIQEYKLEKSDRAFPDPDDTTPTIVSVRSASTGDVEKRALLFNQFKRTFDSFGNFSIEQEVTMDDVRRTEVFLTLTACNIKDHNEKPLFKFENGKLADRGAFEAAWAKLPPIASEEIHECVLKHNKLWTAEGEVPPNKESEISETVSESTSDS